MLLIKNVINKMNKMIIYLKIYNVLIYYLYRLINDKQFII